MIEKFLDFIENNRLFDKNEPILLSVSGGVDSVVMAHLFEKASLNFGIAHLNYKLRQEDSDRDESFVEELASQYKVKYFAKRFETKQYAATSNISVQMAARQLRYDWLEEIRKSNGFHYIATAHHQNDSVETVLLNMFRGTGIHGLHGIKAKQGKIIRPILPFFKLELYQYAQLHRISFMEDKSNAETEYDRNKIRLEIIPAIEKHFASVQQTFAGNIEKWTDTEWLYEFSVNQLKKKLTEKKGDEFIISIPGLLRYDPYKTLLYEFIKEFEFTPEQAGQISSALNATPGKIFSSPKYRILKDRKHLIISEISSPNISEFLITEETKSLRINSLKLKFDVNDGSLDAIPKDSAISCLDLKELEFPLLLRKWKKGDYFYPFGMKKKKKKISDYLIDRKIPLNEKENIWVIESNKRIACIIGERIDERFRITPSSSKMLLVQILDK